VAWSKKKLQLLDDTQVSLQPLPQRRAFLVHGWFSSTENLEEVKIELYEAGYEVIEVNYQSSLSLEHMQLQVEAQLQKNNYSPDKDLYIGHSMGGIIGSRITGGKNLITINSPFVSAGENIQATKDPSVITHTSEHYYTGTHSDFGLAFKEIFEDIIS
jgi:hypothetical protein